MTTQIAPVSEVGRVTYLDPTGFVHQVERQLTPRLSSVAGKVAGLMDNGNDTSSYFFNSLAKVLEREYGVKQVVLKTKFTSTRPAEPSLIDQMGQETDFLIAGVAL